MYILYEIDRIEGTRKKVDTAEGPRMAHKKAKAIVEGWCASDDRPGFSQHPQGTCCFPVCRLSGEQSDFGVLITDERATTSRRG